MMNMMNLLLKPTAQPGPSFSEFSVRTDDSFCTKERSLLGLFLRTILMIENGSHKPCNAAERRIDAVLWKQVMPHSRIERLFMRWHEAGRPMEGIHMVDAPVSELDWRYEY